MTESMVSRREAILSGLGWLGVAGPLAAGDHPAQELDPFQTEGPDEGDAGRLNYPWAAGQSRARVVDGDNDPFVINIEGKIKCNCGCAHSLYVCRTTDFNCQFWQPLHAGVVAMAEQGNTAAEIVDAYVAEHGQEYLMAPPPRGFNLAGYLVPGVVLGSVAAMMMWVLQRRQRVMEPASAVSDGFSVDERARLDAALRDLDA